jgi:hypothetical protein
MNINAKYINNLLTRANREKTGILVDGITQENVGFQITHSQDYSQVITFLLSQYVQDDESPINVVKVSAAKLATIIKLAKNKGF